MNLLDYLSFRLDIIFRIIGLFVLCGVFFWMVRRGKWIKWSHPICSACGHNLTGLPESSTNCPECGGELAKVRRRAIWRRRWVSLGVSVVFFLVCLTILAAIAWVHIDKAPKFVLMWMRQNPRVYGILYTSWSNGELSVAQETILADELVARHGAMWNIEPLREQGRVPNSSWRKYALQLLSWPPETRRIIGRGDPLAFKLFVWGPYNGSIHTQARLHLDIDGIEIPSDQSWHQWIDHNVVPAGPSVAIPSDVQNQLSDGSHQLHVAVEGHAIDKSGEMIARDVSHYTFALTILPRGKSAITLVPPTIKPGMVRSSKDQEICIYLDGASYPDFLDYDCFPEYRNGKGYSYKLFARQDGHEYYFGTLMHSDKETYWEPANPVPPLHWPTCDVIFKVDPEAAKKTIGMYTVIDQGFEVDNVVVRKKPLKDR